MKLSVTKSVVAILAITLMAVSLLGCETKGIVYGNLGDIAMKYTQGDIDDAHELKQGLYVTIEDITANDYASVKLYDDNKFAFDRGTAVSSLQTGVYSNINGKLTLHISDDAEYIFEINDDILIFRSANYLGQAFSFENYPEHIKPGTIFKFSENK